MRFNTRIGVIAAVITTGIYLMLPDMHEGRFDQVVTYAALYYIVALLCAWSANELLRIQRERKDATKRPVRGNRDNLRTDIKLKKKAWIIEIPAERVVND